MSGWLRYFALKAQVSTGISTHIVIWAIVAAVAVVAAVIFLLVTAFVWLAQLYGGVVAGLILAGLFALIALIAAVTCVIIRRRNMQRARLELAARSNATWFDPKLVGVGWQIGQAIGWRRLASLAAVAVLAAAVAKEWSDRDAPADEPAGDS
ncbi:MAG: hypothetical protein WBW74_20530 [Xanthobacteraceae bacterium]